jgi:stage V sporulation protein D (sporulation-specific penicillin-binding protein)
MIPPILVKKKKLVKYSLSSYNQGKGPMTKDYRIIILLVFFFCFWGIVTVRLFKLQVMDNQYYTALAADQHEIFRQLYPVRGSIYVADKNVGLIAPEKNYSPVAANKKLSLLYAVPSSIKDADAILEALREVFQMKIVESFPKEEEIAKMTKEQLEIYETEKKDTELFNKWKTQLAKTDDPYEPLKHFVSDEEMAKITAYNFEGIGSTDETTRYYPEKNIGSNLLGFVGKQSDNNILKGSYGIEGCYDKELAGEAGFLRAEKDSAGRWIAIAGQDFVTAKDGVSYVLTIDKAVQYFACDALNKAVESLKAENGSVIIMEPATGRIIAMCNAPDYDPNKYNEVEDIAVFNNYGLTESYEPGSVFKAVTMAAALDTGVVDPYTGYEDPGTLKYDQFTINNSDNKAHGWQTMTQVLEKSLNTGMVFAVKKVGFDEFKRYLSAFEFGKPSGIDLCNDSAGNLKSLDKPYEVYLATASFGQGITTTLMQLVKAYGAVANEGKLMQPYVIDQILDKDGKVIEQKKPKEIRQVISGNSARLLSGMLVSVIKNGHGGKAAIPGFEVAGKTGTAQIPDFEHGGYTEKTAHTFMGFFPYKNPRFVMGVKITAPKDERYAETSAAPLFGKIGKYLVEYYNVPPEVK